MKENIKLISLILFVLLLIALILSYLIYLDIIVPIRPISYKTIILLGICCIVFSFLFIKALEK